MSKPTIGCDDCECPCYVVENYNEHIGKPIIVGLRLDAGKSRVDLLPTSALEGAADVLAYGAAKYGEHNYRLGMKWSRVIACLLRHTFKFMRGEDIDEESGLPHVDLMLTNAMFLAEYYRSRKSFDDRYKVTPDAPTV